MAVFCERERERERERQTETERERERETEREREREREFIFHVYVTGAPTFSRTLPVFHHTSSWNHKWLSSFNCFFFAVKMRLTPQILDMFCKFTFASSLTVPSNFCVRDTQMRRDPNSHPVHRESKPLCHTPIFRQMSHGHDQVPRQ